MAYRNKIALVYLLGFALDLVNMFAAAIAYPAISQELQASVTQLAWVGNASSAVTITRSGPAAATACFCGPASGWRSC